MNRIFFYLRKYGINDVLMHHIYNASIVSYCCFILLYYSFLYFMLSIHYCNSFTPYTKERTSFCFYNAFFYDKLLCIFNYNSKIIYIFNKKKIKVNNDKKGLCIVRTNVLVYEIRSKKYKVFKNISKSIINHVSSRIL